MSKDYTDELRTQSTYLMDTFSAGQPQLSLSQSICSVVANGVSYQPLPLPLYMWLESSDNSSSNFVPVSSDIYIKIKNGHSSSYKKVSLYTRIDQEGRIVCANNVNQTTDGDTTVCINGQLSGCDSKTSTQDTDVKDIKEEYSDRCDDEDTDEYTVMQDSSSSLNVKVIRKKRGRPKITVSCKNCATEFRSKLALTKHKKTCDGCNQNENKPGHDELMVPTVKLTQEGVNRCHICNQEFVKISALNNHIRTKHPVSKVTHSCDPVSKVMHSCDCCQESFSTRRELHNHFETQHSNDRGYHCPHCSKLFSCARALHTHIKIHSGVRPHVCDLCGKRFLKLNSLSVHWRTHSGERPYQCDFCAKTFAQSGVLQSHTKSVHTNEKPFVCDICGRAFLWMNKLRIHTRKHTGEKPYQCTQCEKHFSRASGLRVHQRIHTGERPFLCKICDKAFVQLSALLVHKRTHTGERPFTCKLCPKTFTSMSGLQSHVRSKHTGERPFSCDTCHKSFIDRCGLKTHQNIHLSIKPFICEVCGKAFSDSGHLRSHKKCHSDVRPHECETCLVSFKDRQTLRKHVLRTHSSLKAYGCDLCDRHFADTSSLAQHKTRNHKGNKSGVGNTMKNRKQNISSHTELNIPQAVATNFSMQNVSQSLESLAHSEPHKAHSEPHKAHSEPQNAHSEPYKAHSNWQQHTDMTLFQKPLANVMIGYDPAPHWTLPMMAANAGLPLDSVVKTEAPNSHLMTPTDMPSSHLMTPTDMPSSHLMTLANTTPLPSGTNRFSNSHQYYTG